MKISIILITLFIIIGVYSLIKLYKEIKKIDLSKPHNDYD